MLRISVVGLAMAMAAVAGTGTSSPTFNKDVLPILQKNCQGCHRPGEVAPMSLITYKDARPWAKAMKVAVVTQKMPPWFAEYGHFANDRTLSPADLNTLVAWANNGAPEGDAKDAPPPLTFPEGWQIKPDMMIEMPKPFHVKATGTINYQNIKVHVNFPEDKWVVAAEMRAGNPKVVHHMRAIVAPPGATWMSQGSVRRSLRRRLGSDDRRQGRHGPARQVQSWPGRAALRRGRLGQVRAEGFRHRIQYPLHGGGHGAGRSFESRTGVRKDASQAALLDVARNSGGLQSGASARRGKCRSGERSDRRRGSRRAGLHPAPHASARQGL